LDSRRWPEEPVQQGSNCKGCFLIVTARVVGGDCRALSIPPSGEYMNRKTALAALLSTARMASPARRILAAGTVAATTVGLLAGVTVSALAQPAPDPQHHPHATIRTEVHNDRSIPLRSIAPVPVGTQLRENEPVHRMPQRSVTHRPDPVVQT